MQELITLDNNTSSVQFLCKRDKRVAKIVTMVGKITYSPYHNEGAYRFLIHEIIEQMLSIKVGMKIFERLENLCGGFITPQKIDSLSDDQIKSIGTSAAKVKYIRGLTNAVVNGTLNFSDLEELPDQEVIKKLTSQHGIGKWTAKMYLIFVLNRQDVLPYEDVAFLQSYKWAYKTDDISIDSIKKKCKKWKPYSSIAVRYFYKALDMGLTKNEFHLYK